ncbi:MAG: SH3 domain-containing protein [Alphaproteobacteria bacterium]|jgi:SH3-like domain-containing protein|nr:SH3 domain-containing protein [Candidatus Jidaibacter sp.]
MRILRIISLLILSFSIAYGAFAKESGSSTGRSIPRFIILKSNETNLRKGPNVRFPIVQTYKRKGYPMEVIAEFENWRKLRDRDGMEGWVHENLITGTRNAVISDNKYKSTSLTYKINDKELILFRYPDETSYPISRVEFGSIGKLKKCQKEWCKIKFNEVTAWALKSNLWGVYSDEIID